MKKRTKCGCLKRSPSQACTLTTTFSTRSLRTYTKDRCKKRRFYSNNTCLTSCFASPLQSRRSRLFSTRCTEPPLTPRSILRFICRASRNYHTQTSLTSSFCWTIYRLTISWSFLHTCFLSRRLCLCALISKCCCLSPSHCIVWYTRSRCVCSFRAFWTMEKTTLITR